MVELVFYLTKVRYLAQDVYALMSTWRTCVVQLGSVPIGSVKIYSIPGLYKDLPFIHTLIVDVCVFFYVCQSIVDVLFYVLYSM